MSARANPHQTHPGWPHVPPNEPRSVRVNRAFWDAISARYQEENAPDLEGRLTWGPSCPPEDELHVLGDVSGKDVLDLACGGGQTSVWLAQRGARVVGVDASPEQLRHARENAARAGVDARFEEASVDDLSFLLDASFDVALSAFALGYVERIDETFREVARLLRPGGLFAFSWSSPLFERTSLTPEGMLLVSRPYWDRAPLEVTDEDGACIEWSRTYGDWFGALVRAGLVVMDILEPPPEPRESTWSTTHPLAKLQLVPGTTIWRARKPAG
jgi:2-polyprenyl-3-methyl-5-hydroxy-6-metoxy-1,4-benzoquinol methylase